MEIDLYQKLPSGGDVEKEEEDLEMCHEVTNSDSVAEYFHSLDTAMGENKRRAMRVLGRTSAAIVESLEMAESGVGHFRTVRGQDFSSLVADTIGTMGF